MQITLNNTPVMLTPGQTLQEVLEGAGYAPKGGMAVAVNSAVVRRADWNSFVVPEGAEILVINAAYGG